VELLGVPPGVLHGEAELIFRDLGREECLGRLREGSLGRLGVTVGALPLVLPVHYCLDPAIPAVVIRSMPGSKLDAATREAVVAFEIDDYDPDLGRGWSVVVQGRSRAVSEPETIARLRRLPLPMVAGDGSDDRFITVDLDIVSGRELVRER
jgi:hypothetical protein